MQIQNRGWQVLAKQLEAVVVPVLQEFYTNAYKHENFQVFVWGKCAFFDRSTINCFYQLPNVDIDEYSQCRY